jgi:hypothetical protein
MGNEMYGDSEAAKASLHSFYPARVSIDADPDHSQPFGAFD